MQLSQNQKIFSQFFFWISEIYINFGTLSKGRLSPEVIYFENYRLQKAGSLKCLKSLVSEHLWTVNMLKGPKDCLNLHDRNFLIFFDHSERKNVRKIIFSSI